MNLLSDLGVDGLDAEKEADQTTRQLADAGNHGNQKGSAIIIKHKRGRPQKSLNSQRLSVHSTSSQCKTYAGSIVLLNFSVNSFQYRCVESSESHSENTLAQLAARTCIIYTHVCMLTHLQYIVTSDLQEKIPASEVQS